jgi:hemerythrin-like domain-containing protein
MATPDAARPTTAGSPFADTRDMIVVHTAFRREFRLVPALVRATADGDTTRAKVVADHLELITMFLHHHHAGEDRLLWPTLLDRIADEHCPLVLLMEAHHEAISAQLEVVEELRALYCALATAECRDDLAVALDRLYQLLDEHLTAEEQRILPLAARYLGAAEWAHVGEEGLGTLPKRYQTLALGFMSYEGDPGVLAIMLSGAPRPVRLIGPLLGARAFRRYARRVHGTATP